MEPQGIHWTGKKAQRGKFRNLILVQNLGNFIFPLIKHSKWEAYTINVPYFTEILMGLNITPCLKLTLGVKRFVLYNIHLFLTPASNQEANLKLINKWGDISVKYGILIW